MKAIHYEVTGEEEYSFDITIDKQGEFHIRSGTYASDRPRSGQLTPDQEQAMLAALDELGVPADHPMPKGSSEAFQAQLVIGEGEDAHTYPFWEGALEEDSKLLKLVRLLETL
jgi:hypothetical protein